MNETQHRIIAKRNFSFPIFCTLLILYSIFVSLPNFWLFWAFVALILDYSINPIYQKIEYEWVIPDDAF